MIICIYFAPLTYFLYLHHYCMLQPNDTDLVYYKNGVYQSNATLEELPGLAAWTLDKSENSTSTRSADISGKWSVDMETYFEVREVFCQRGSESINQTKLTKPTRKVILLVLLNLFKVILIFLLFNDINC
jgi:hypothetical protein